MRELAPGTVVAGYRIDAFVGRGGMGVVYRAVQEKLNRVVALKVIAPELLDDEDVRARFLSEAHAAASVDHPNVIPIHDAGEADGVAYIAMRYVAGDDLRSLVRRGGALDPAEAADLVAQAGAALDAIHRGGFVHRDVKPANLLVDSDRHVYLTDFGLAKAVLTRTGGTRTGQWVGTLDYIAPEQIRGGRIDARADVYALGGVLHYALTGHVPFEREGDEAKLWAQLSAPPPLPSSQRRGLRGEFDVAVARAMAKTAEERYPSAGDLGRAARAAALGRSPTEPERMVARGAAAPDAAPTEPGLAAEASTRTARVSPPPPPRRRTALVVAAGALAAAALAAILIVALGDEPQTRAAGDATPTATASPTATAAALPHIVKRIPNIGDRPTGIALAGGDLWVTSPRQPRLTRIDAATGDERSNHPNVGVDSTAIVGYRNSVWVALGASREVVEIDARTGKERARIPIPGGPRRLAVNHAGLWVGTNSSTGQPGMVLRYDRATGKLLQSITIAEGVGPMIATADAIWVVRRDTGELLRIDTGSTTPDHVADLRGPVRSMRYGAGAIWLVLDDKDVLAKVTTEGRGPFTTAAGHAPTQAIVAGGRVFVASRDDQSVLMFDPDTLEQVGTSIGVGLNPVAMVADGRSIWVTLLGDNQVTQIAYR